MSTENQQPNQQTKTDAEEKKKRPKLPSIRTYKSDASEYVQKQDLSVSELFVKQQEQKPIKYNVEEKPPEPKKKSKKLLVVTAVVLIGVAVGASAYFFWLETKKNQLSNMNIPPPRPIITSEKETILTIEDRKDFKNKVEVALNEQYDPGDLVYLPTKKQLDTAIHYLNSREFLIALDIDAPPFLTSFLETDFFLGIINLQKKHPLLIFEIEKGKYQNAFGGMLEWEKTLLNDLNFVARKENLGETKRIVFKDKIVENQTVRTIETEKGEVLLYTVLNRTFIIITDDENALKEIIRRFVLYKFS